MIWRIRGSGQILSEGTVLNSVTIHRFKSLTNLTLPLGRVTVLVGTNNSGKSSTLQAIQFGVSAVQSLALASTRRERRAESGTLAADQLVYTPLRAVETLAQGARLTQTAATQIEIGFQTADGDAKIVVRRGKNKNLTIALSGDAAVIAQLQNLENPYSAISPGLAGIPPVEEFRASGVVRRAAAYGDANSVFRNVLYILRQDGPAWSKFQERIRRIFPDVEIDVSFNAAQDEHITATVKRAGSQLPIDASGTGILQAAQILSYIGVYQPRLLILDEPDSHLHPSNQREMVNLLQEAAEEDEFQVLLSTHSRHMLDECIEIDAEIHWIDDGSLRESDPRRLPVLLSLGALDIGDRLKNGEVKQVVLTEDKKTRYLKAILKSSGFTTEETSIWAYEGCTNIGAARVMAAFLEDNAPGCKILIHRDRDYLSEYDVSELCRKYSSAGFKLFLTRGVDIESHFLTVEHLAMVYPQRTADEIAGLLARATYAAESKSVRVLTNARFEQAQARWDRATEARKPQAGRIAEEAKCEYDSDPERLRHGKETLKQFNKLAEAEWDGSRDIAVPTNALRELDLME